MTLRYGSTSSVRMAIFIVLFVTLFLAFASGLRLSGSRAIGYQNRVSITSAASYAATVAPDSIAVIFGSKLATRLVIADRQPLPTDLAGTTVTIGGKPAPLFYVSPEQINCLVPPDLQPGQHAIVVQSGDGTISNGDAQVRSAAPGIFTADGSGKGRPAAQLLRVVNNVVRPSEAIGTAPLDLGAENDQVYLILYLTGQRRATSNVRVLIGNSDVPAAAAAVAGLAGLDQVNALIPRSLIGRGRVNVSVAVPGLALSNEVQLDFAGSTGAGAPQVTGFDVGEASAGEAMFINGGNFNPDRAKNVVRVGGVEASVLEVSSGRLRVQVPYGAESGPVTVINERGEGRSVGNLRIRTSLSGFVEDTRRQPLADVTVKVIRDGNALYQTKSTAEGLFIFKNLPNLGTLVNLEIDPTGSPQLGSLPFPKVLIKKRFAPDRDNYIERIPLQQESGPGVQVGGSGGQLNANAPDQAGFARQIATGGVVFEIQPDTPAQFPDNSTSGRVTMTVVADSRTPVALPASEYSSSVIQLTPFNARFQRGGKLTFPNPERFAPGTQARLYRFIDSPANAESRFEEVGKAQVSADGQRIETVDGAIDATSYYFVSLPRQSTTVIGRVVDSDRQTPIRGALVSSRGQTALTDGDGSFVLRSVLVNPGDQIAVEAGYLRPNGRVDRGQLSNIPAVIESITTLLTPIALTSQEDNRRPIVLAPSSLIVSETEIKEVSLIVAHPDNGQVVDLTVSGANFASRRLISGGLYSLRLAPPIGARGVYTLRLIAIDNLGQTVTYEVDLTVNGRPTATPQTIVVNQDQPRSFTLSGEDPEGYALGYVIVANPANGRLTGALPNLTYTPNPGFIGNDQLIFKVNDALIDSAEARVTILVNSVNHPPVLTVPGAQTVAVGSLLNFTVTASDPDVGQTLTITATNRPGGSTFTQTSNTAQFSWTPNVNQAGNYTVTFEVADSGTPTLRGSKTVAITVTSGNRAPVANAQTVTTNEDTLVNITLTGSDPDGNALTYTIVGNPSNGNLTGSGANRTYTPRQDFNGTDSFSFKVNDGALDSNTATVSITITPVNDPPVLTVPGAQMVMAGQPLSFAVSAFDVDTGQTLTLTASNLPSGVTFTQTSATGGQFDWTPSVTQAGNYTVTFRAADNGSPSLSDSKTVSITVSNRAPIANAQSVTTNEDTPANITLTGSDPDGNPITYAIVTNPTNGTLTGSGANRTYTPNLNFNGTDSFNFKVNDGALDSSIATVSITVTAVNYAPILAVPGAQMVTAGQPLSFAVTASDVDVGQTLTITPLATPIGGTFAQTSATGGQFNWTPSAAQVGTYIIIFRVTDNGSPSLSDSKNVQVTVNAPPNPTPTTTSLNPSSATAGGPAFTLTVNGTNFVGGSVVRWNGSDRATTFVSSTQLTAQIPASDLTTAGTANVTVFNPTPGGGLSNPVSFTVSTNSLQWRQTSGPTGGEIRAFAVSGTSLFAGTNGGGIFRSADNGASWTPVNNGLTFTFVDAFAVSGTSLFAGTNGGGIFRSTDNGANWTPVNNGLTATRVNALTVSGTSLFAGTLGGVFRSTDNGTSWTLVNNGLTDVRISAFTLSGTGLFVGTNGSGVFRSTDNGTSWTPFNNGLTNTFVYALTVNGTSLFAGTNGGNGGGVFRSTDSGANWTPVNIGLTDVRVYSLAVSGTSLFAGTFSGVFRSTDDGANWTPVNNGLTNAPVYALTVRGASLFAGTDRCGVFRSSDNGASWAPVNNGLTATYVYALIVRGTSLFAGTNGGGVFRSTDNGASWTPVNNGLTTTIFLALTVSGTSLFAGTNGVFRSPDNGASWTPVNNGLTNAFVYALTVSGTSLFAGTFDGGVFRSTDNGASWMRANNGLTGLTGNYVYAFAVSGTSLFAGTSGGGVFRSTDNGASWTPVNNGLTNTNVSAFTVSGTSLFAGTSGGGVFRSPDNGASWTQVNNGLTTTDVFALTVSGTSLFAGTRGGGVFRSTDNGASWTAINTGLTNLDVRSFVVSGTRLFAATGGSGVFVLDLTGNP